VDRDEHIPQPDAAGHQFLVRLDVLEPVEAHQVRRRLADRAHRQRFADGRFDQVGDEAVLDELPFLLHPDFGDRGRAAVLRVRCGRRQEPGRQQREDQPSHQNACLTRTSRA
jgi:hypothetical protein